MSAAAGSGRITRRAVLRGAAVAGAAALVDPAAVLARASSTGRVFSANLGSLPAGLSAPILAAGPFSLLGVQWSHPVRTRIELRTRTTGDAGWSRWVPATVTGHEPDSGGSRAAGHFGEPVWTGPAEIVQLRAAGAVYGVRLHFVAPRADHGSGMARTAAAPPLAQPTLDAGPGQPPIIARAAWAHGHAPPNHVAEYGTVKLAFVHHSESPNGYAADQVPAILLSIFDYHRYVRDFFDIGYNFAVDAFGRIWEARAGGIDAAVIGAHAGGYNGLSTGVVVLGSFMALPPPPAALDALSRLLAWKLSLHGVPARGRVPVRVAPSGASYSPYAAGTRVSLPRIAGHRDGDQTSCPGDALYGRLPSIRPRVARLAGAPARLSIAAPVAPVSPGTSVTITGRLTDLATAAPVSGAPLEIQQIGPRGGESTVATVSTAADGGWSYTAAPPQNTLLRVLHRPAPATVSDIVVLAVAPALTLALVSTAPLTVSGTVTPSRVRVTLDLYRVVKPGQRRLVHSKQLAAAGGQFHAMLGRPRAGSYVLVARTQASARYAAGASPALAFTI